MAAVRSCEATGTQSKPWGDASQAATVWTLFVLLQVENGIPRQQAATRRVECYIRASDHYGYFLARLRFPNCPIVFRSGGSPLAAHAQQCFRNGSIHPPSPLHLTGYCERNISVRVHRNGVPIVYAERLDTPGMGPKTGRELAHI